jgi:two-component system OmpR family sensor kinase/two-component system sensor histidine kinase BaeS
MNRLWVRLSIAFSVVVLLGVAILILASFLIAQSGVRESMVLDELRAPNRLLDRLATFYEENGSWDDLGEFLSQNNAVFALVPDFGLSVFVMDDEGTIIYAEPPDMIGQNRDVNHLGAVAPIQAQGVIRGYVGVEEKHLEFPPAQARIVLEGLSRALLTVAFVGGTIGVLFGAMLGRRLAAPLNRLTEAARAIGAQNLSRRVKEEGTTEVIELARAFNDMAAALEQNEKLRRNLVADVAHELRTPLSVLQGNLRAILDDVYPMEKSEVARLFDQTLLLSRLVEDLHELSQAEAKQLPLNIQPVSVSELLDSIVARFGAMAEEKQVTLNVEAPHDLPPLCADHTRLSQVMHNLLNNALVHTPAGGRVTIRAQRDGDTFKLAVQDTGEGIRPEDLPYIFERFYRADRSRSRDTGSTGLGLAIVKAIVEAHGGRITVSSPGQLGQGSTFTVEFPPPGTVEPAPSEVKHVSSERV